MALGDTTLRTKGCCNLGSYTELNKVNLKIFQGFHIQELLGSLQWPCQRLIQRVREEYQEDEISEQWSVNSKYFLKHNSVQYFYYLSP
jgi:hypothetical protein